MKRKVVIAPAERVDKLSSPFLAELDALKQSLVRRGREVVDLGSFSLTVAPPEGDVDLRRFTALQIRRTLTEYLVQVYGARINPDRETMLLPGGRATLLVLGAYLVEPGRVCFVPDPGFSAYRHMVVLFNGVLQKYQLFERNDYLPNMKQFEGCRSKAPRLLLLNSPHNPTGAVCDKACYNKLEQVAGKENVLAIVDSSYCLNSIGNLRSPIFLDQRKRFKAGLEIFSLSTNLCAPELKLTLLVGRNEHLLPIARLVNSFGLVPCSAVVQAAARYLASTDCLSEHLERCREAIRVRTSMIARQLSEAGIEYYPTITMPYLWVKLKRGRVSLSFARSLLRRHAIVVAPGSAFGEEGEGWIRIAANAPETRLQSAVQEIVKHYQPIRARLRDRRKL